jgi:hypothetical protein
MEQGDGGSNPLLGLFSSISILCVLFLFLSSAIVPAAVNEILVEGNVLKSGRYAITHPGLESIGEQGGEPIIAIGSSVMQYAVDGTCITDKLDSKSKIVYNLAIGGANPYTEMLQIPDLVASKPEKVLLDLGPNALWSFYESESLDDYIEFRFTILSLTLELGEEHGWQHLIREKDKQFVASSLEERIKLTGSYSQAAFENILSSEMHDLIDIPYNERNIPEIGDADWISYLQTPNFLPPLFENMNHSEVRGWFDENMPKRAKYGVYNPQAGGTLNHASLEYAISTLRASGIEVYMVAIPHHPMVYEYLEPGQIDGHNATLNYFEQEYGAHSINWFWEEWDQQMFRDRNHLGDEGRVYFCERISEELNQMLE